MDPSDARTEFGASLGVRSRAPVYVVIAASVLLVGLGFLGNLASEQTGEAPPRPPVATAPLAAATPRPALRTPPPATPGPTLEPMVAPVTTAELAPTGVVVADTGALAVDSLVPDADGTIWVHIAGGVANVDPLTGRSHEWTLADDPAFVTASLVRARRGGVWLVNPGVIRLFDGERFRVVIETPPWAWPVVEGPDGTLWAASEPYGLIRWTDGVWTSGPPGRPGWDVNTIVVDGGDRVWTADYDRGAQATRGLSAWDGRAWTTFTADDLRGVAGIPGVVPSLLPSGDGVWIAVGTHLARFEADRWTRYDVADLTGRATLSAVDDDGRLWFVRDSCGECGVRIQMLDGSTLTTFTDEDGLPGADEVAWPSATILSGPGYVLAATEAGLYRFGDGAWRRLEMSTRSGSPGPGSGRPAAPWSLAAVSRNEVWATNWWTDVPGEDGLFSFDGGGWQRQQLPVGSSIGQAVVGPDGALWAATASGPTVRRNGAWISLGDTVARVVPEQDGDGTACGGAIFVSGDGVVYYGGPRSANRLVTLTPVGSSWEASLHPAPPLADPCNASIAVTADGAIWLVQRGWGSTLSRSDGGPWEVVSLPSAEGTDVHVYPVAIVVDRSGSLWAAANTSTTEGLVRTDVMELAGGQWIHHGGDGGLEIVNALALLPDGSLIAVGNGMAQYDGRRWRHWWPDVWLDDVSVAPDGTVWVAGPNVYRLPSSLP